jgi:hypothetical protein
MVVKMPPNKTVSHEFALSREELVLILRLLEAQAFPGLLADPLGEMTGEQEALSLVFAERAMRSRGFAALKDGKLVILKPIMQALLAAIAPMGSVVITHFRGKGFPLQLYISHLEDNYVVHRVVDQVLYQFSVFSDKAEHIDPVLDEIGANTLPLVEEALTIEIPYELLQEVIGIAEQQGSKVAVDFLIGHGTSVQSAQNLAAVLGDPHSVTIFQHINFQQPGGQGELRMFTLLHNQNSAWLFHETAANSELMVGRIVDTRRIRELVSV